MKKLVCFVTMFFVMLIGFIQPAFALDPPQRLEIERRPWFDRTDCYPTGGGTASTPAPTGGVSAGKVVLIGDSIIAGDKSNLETAFQQKGGGWSATVDGLNSRGLVGGPTAPNDGMAAIAANADAIKGAKVVVIGLGTNPPALDANNIKAAIDAIKATGFTGKIFWINNASVDKTKYSANNQALQAAASQNGFTVIDWKALADQHPEFFAGDSLGVHPIKGYTEYTKLILDTVTGGGSATPATTSSGSGGCGCSVSGGGSTVNLVGNTNVEKSFNFFISQGLTPQQASGIVGNLMVESGPNIEPTADNGGHRGIAQWDKSPGDRWDKLKAFATAHGAPSPDELGIQLQFLWQEMPSQKGGKNIDALSAVKATSSPSDAAVAFEEAFERSGGSANETRIKNANDVFASFGSNAPTSPGTPSTPNTTNSTNSCSNTTGSSSTIDPNLPQGTREELFAKIKASGKITANVDLLGAPQMKATILAVVLKLTEKYSFSIGSTYRNDGGPHSTGGAVDLGNINGQGVPTGEDYAGFNQIAADFIRDAATVNPGGAGAYIGVPNEKFKAIEEPIITGKGGTTLIETRANGLAQGAHFHINVAPNAP